MPSESKVKPPPRPIFQTFDSHKPVRIYRTNLPHWRQDGCTYFVTFRLANSIPKEVLNAWQNEKKSWLALHGIEMDPQKNWLAKFLQLPTIEQRRFDKIFNRKTNDYLDGSHGRCILCDLSIRAKLKHALNYFDGDRYQLGDWIIMPNRVHLLMRPNQDHQLEKILQTIKKESARQINAALDLTGTLWQKDTHNHIVRTADELSVFQSYIAKNPQKANLPKGSYSHKTAEHRT